MSEEALVTHGILAHGDSCVKNSPLPRVIPFLLCLWLGYRQTKENEESTLFCRVGWVTEGVTRVPPEIIFMFPQGGAVGAPKDQVMIQVVPGVPDRHVP